MNCVREQGADQRHFLFLLREKCKTYMKPDHIQSEWKRGDVTSNSSEIAFSFIPTPSSHRQLGLRWVVW